MEKRFYLLNLISSLILKQKQPLVELIIISSETVKKEIKRKLNLSL
jgi:hypothetical protein